MRPDEPGAPSAPAPPRAHDTDPWEIARHNFPCVDDATGRLATRLLHEFGEALLNRARKPWDQLITLAALRHAARLLRGELHEGEAADTGAGPVADVLSLQAYAQRNGLAPMLVGYTGPGRPAVQALGLLRDARTLRDAVAAAGPGATDRADVWQRAIDFHAFAIVALDPRMLLELPMEEAYEIAAAAIRQADVAQRSPDSEIWPLLPPGCACSPQVVRTPRTGVPATGPPQRERTRITDRLMPSPPGAADSVMAGSVPAIHVLPASCSRRRGWPWRVAVIGSYEPAAPARRRTLGRWHPPGQAVATGGE